MQTRNNTSIKEKYNVTICRLTRYSLVRRGVDTELKALPVHVIRHCLHPRWEPRRVGDDAAVGVAIDLRDEKILGRLACPCEANRNYISKSLYIA